MCTRSFKLQPLQTAFCTMLLALLAIRAAAQQPDSAAAEDRSSFSLQINQDNTFNFFPAVFGSIGLKRFDLTFYAIFWTTPAFANPDGTGSLIEAGAGLGFTAGDWYLNPYVGLTHGMFTNGRDSNGVGRPSLAESIVPGVLVLLKDQRWEGEFFAAFYQHLRKEVAPQTNYLFLWALPGVRVSRHFSTGLHYEQFRDTPEDIEVYARYGLYAKLTFREKYEFRLSGGLNYTPGETQKEQGDFYKLTVNIPF